MVANALDLGGHYVLLALPLQAICKLQAVLVYHSISLFGRPQTSTRLLHIYPHWPKTSLANQRPKWRRLGLQNGLRGSQIWVVGRPYTSKIPSSFSLQRACLSGSFPDIRISSRRWVSRLRAWEGAGRGDMLVLLQWPWTPGPWVRYSQPIG